MDDTGSNPSLSADGAPPACLLNDPGCVMVGKGAGLCLFDKSTLDVIMQLPLPGVVIFVHGVNSDGEWYEATEKGLCAGLNERLKRCDENLKFTGAAAGQLIATTFISELTADGFINPKMSPKTFIQGDDTFSPVIRFRWGYKASSEELQTYGSGIYLNEEDYWGGGPFANGCTALPDMWGEGMSENLFLWMHVQHLNPTERPVYTCPPRPYFVLAALRLARLVESLRRLQADVPITIVCHSQGNMIGMAAAFLGDKFEDVSDAANRVGHCVADNYVLCNPPYSLVGSNAVENWSESSMRDSEGRTGRQTQSAREQTLKAFFKIVGRQKSREQVVERIDKRMANEAHGFTAGQDRQQYGYNNSTYGRVTLYCNPHDQVISSATVQGIGWRGMSAQEIDVTEGHGVFTQRVFAQDFEVGKQGAYDYWEDHSPKLQPGDLNFWFPRSPTAQYSISKGLEANDNFVGKILTMGLWMIVKPLTYVMRMPINALPDKGWKIPLQAPNPPKAFMPESVRFGVSSKKFDEAYDIPGQSRDTKRVREANDAYAGDRPIPKGSGEGQREDSDAAKGNADSEAELRYEDHAHLRMQARREGKYRKDQKVTEEDKPDTASDSYKEWRSDKIKMNLAASIDTNATDHSSIMTNGMHARQVLAYDVAIGNCDIPEEDLHKLRIAADWRFLDGLKPGDPHRSFLRYFNLGKIKEVSAYDWAHAKGSEGAMPETITDERQNAVPQQRGDA